jgi:hypothetical protein
MRHYIIHFWQQLPSHIEIDLEVLKHSDLNLYCTLEDIYLKLETSLEQLKHLNAIATLMPLWIDKAMVTIDQTVKDAKMKEAIKWKCRVKTQFEMIVLAKVSEILSCI